MANQMPPVSGAVPPEQESIKSMLHIAKLLAMVFGLVFLVAGTFFAVAAVVHSVRTGVPAIWLLLSFLVAGLVYTQVGPIEAKVDAHQYEVAKSETLIWTVLGLIFGLVLGIVLLVAFLKFDPLIRWQRTQPQGGAPPSAYAPPYAVPVPAAVPPAPAPAPPPAAVPSCAKCGQPTTYIAQYGRYYCYSDNLYV